MGKPTKRSSRTPSAVVTEGGETHQTTTSGDSTLTTNQGIPVSDNQNSLTSGARGPALLEDFILREKITHFDHERIPERIVHARGSAAHGYFEAARGASKFSKAAFLQDPGKRTKVFARISTVAGGAGSVDTPRDVRGFAVKFYTEEGNFDLVGNNIPVFFIQDAMKFPDLVHAVKMEPDRGFPQAASAHDTFWDFISLMPESMNMVMWIMSDRTIPYSIRQIEGFGVHTFRLINETGKSTFVKFHWRPSVGAMSTVWDETVKIAGADPDHHRRDLFETITGGDFPEWTLSVQAFDQDDCRLARLRHPRRHQDHPRGDHSADADRPHGAGPLSDNFFAETEQVAFHPGNLVPGIDFTRRSAAAGPAVLLPGHAADPPGRAELPPDPDQRAGLPVPQLPARRPSCGCRCPPAASPTSPTRSIPTGRARTRTRGFKSFPDPEVRAEAAQRPETFADHYSQARQFYRSMTPPEQTNIVSALGFELSKVETMAVRTRMLGHLDLIEPDLGKRVAAAMAWPARPTRSRRRSRRAIDLKPSPALSLVAKAPKTIKGRTLAVLVTDGERCQGDRCAAAGGEEGRRDRSSWSRPRSAR